MVGNCNNRIADEVRIQAENESLLRCNGNIVYVHVVFTGPAVETDSEEKQRQLGCYLRIVPGEAVNLYNADYYSEVGNDTLARYSDKANAVGLGKKNHRDTMVLYVPKGGPGEGVYMRPKAALTALGIPYIVDGEVIRTEAGEEGAAAAPRPKAKHGSGKAAAQATVAGAGAAARKQHAAAAPKPNSRVGPCKAALAAEAAKPEKPPAITAKLRKGSLDLVPLKGPNGQVTNTLYRNHGLIGSGSFGKVYKLKLEREGSADAPPQFCSRLRCLQGDYSFSPRPSALPGRGQDHGYVTPSDPLSAAPCPSAAGGWG
jgi:hypothetical protein